MSDRLPAIDDLVFIGFNRRVAALDRHSGEIRWKWKADSGGGLVTLLVDGDRLIASCQGYTWCLDPLTGEAIWKQPLKGLGIGIACIASVRGSTAMVAAAAAAVASQQSKQQAAVS